MIIWIGSLVVVMMSGWEPRRPAAGLGRREDGETEIRA